MAEFVMKYLAEESGRENDFAIASAATSTEETGNDMHPGVRARLDEAGIPYKRRGARQIIPEDYDEYDLLIGMDDENMYYMRRCFGPDRSHKMHKLLEFCGLARDVTDPWYTDDFDATYFDISRGCTALLKSL
jgi:protein-tyrosine phosphatase